MQINFFEIITIAYIVQLRMSKPRIPDKIFVAHDMELKIKFNQNNDNDSKCYYNDDDDDDG